ncbi:MAG TPA: hypothetical protein DCK98_06665 [Chloroflexi bacterium]|jgi:hypothetical protein|nr:hypothetical protein [Chloroflexota bacterium]HAL27435.1 hypothetical protein [Chloroflexota bacterium]
MFQAVHSDRSGRVFVSADYGATALDGPLPTGLDRAIPLPAGAQLVPLTDRAAIGLDRRGLPRSLGAARWAVAAVLPPGHARTHLPAIEAASDAPALDPLPYTAVAADAVGELVVAAVSLSPSAAISSEDVAPAITRRLRAEPSNKLLRQLARCARDYQCAAARNAFLGRGECALPLGAPANDDAAPLVALRRLQERAPLEPLKLRIPAGDAAAVAVAHFAAGGTTVSFGHACEGEPLDIAREVADVITQVRGQRSDGEIVLHTSGSSSAALGRAADAGLDRVAVRLASAHGPTYERVHRPAGFRWTDVRATLREAASRRLAITVELLSLPGLTDREIEVAALVTLLGELRPGTELRIVDLAADPYALLVSVPGGATIGIARLIDRLRADAAHVNLAA